MSRDPSARRRRYLARALGVVDPRPVLESHHVSDTEFGHWLSQPRFRQRLRALRRELAARRELKLSQGAHRAAMRLSAAATRILDDFTDLQRRVCVDLIKLSRTSPTRRSRPADAAQPLISPDLPPDEAQRLIEEMEDR